MIRNEPRAAHFDDGDRPEQATPDEGLGTFLARHPDEQAALLIGYHPDAAAVFSPVWDALAPCEWRHVRTLPSGELEPSLVTVSLISKRMHEAEDRDAERADQIAALLVEGAVFDRSYTTVFNKQAVRVYRGTGLTQLAHRREGEAMAVEALESAVAREHTKEQAGG